MRPRIARETQRALDELRTHLADDALALRTRVADLVRTVARAPAGLWYRFGMIRGEPYPVEWVARGVSGTLLSRQSEEEIAWPSGDPRLPPPTWIRRFLSTERVIPLETLMQTRLWSRCYSDGRLGDQVRMMVYHRSRHVAWIGALRHLDDPRFDRAAVRRLHAIAEPIADALVHADAIARAASPEEGCDLVLTPDGRVELASTLASTLLSHPNRAAMLHRWARQADSGGSPPALMAGHRVRWSRLVGRQGARYLLHLEPVNPVELHQAHVLSRTQRKVARYASAGAHVREIAQTLDLSESTIRTHLRIAYQALGVASRVELARALEAMPDERPDAADDQAGRSRSGADLSVASKVT